MRYQLRHPLVGLMLGIVTILPPALQAQSESAPQHLHETVLPSSSLTLHEVVQHAMARDPHRNMPEAFRREADALRRRADSLLADSPAISVRHQSDQIGSDKGLREWETNLELPLWRPGQRDASQRLADQAGAVASNSGAALELRVAAEVRDALWGLSMAEQRARLAEQAWQTAQKLEQEVETRLKAGDLSRSDLLLAREETLGKHSDFLTAQTELAHAEQRYRVLTGLEQRPADFTEVQSPLTRVPDSHPLLAESVAQVAKARATLKQVEQSGSASPQLIIGSRQEKPLAGAEYENSVGITLRLPFAGGAHQAPAIAGASAALVDKQGSEAMLRRELSLSLHEAMHRIETMRSELSLSETQYRLARENLRLAHIAFVAGEVDLARLLRVQSRSFAAETAYSLRRLQLQQAVAQYNQAVGVLP